MSGFFKSARATGKMPMSINTIIDKPLVYRIPTSMIVRIIQSIITSLYTLVASVLPRTTANVLRFASMSFSMSQVLFVARIIPIPTARGILKTSTKKSKTPDRT